jgi:hypothetical protein
LASTLLNLVAMTVSSAFGTSATIPLGSAATINGITYLSFSAAGATGGMPITYSILDTGNSETGTATYTSSNATLTGRTPTDSTNGGAAITASSASIILAPARAEDIVTAVTAGTNLTGGGSGGALALSQSSSFNRAQLSSDRSLGATGSVNSLCTVTVSSAGTYFVFGTACCKTNAAAGSRFFSRVSDGVNIWATSGLVTTTVSSAYCNVFCFGVATTPVSGAMTLQAIDMASSQGTAVAADTGSSAGDCYIQAVRIG